MTETSLPADPVINVTGKDIERSPGAAHQSGDAGPADYLDAVAMDAVSARRPRGFDAPRAEPGQHVTLENHGWRPVTVKVPVPDDHDMVGEEEAGAVRDIWLVDVVQRERSPAGAAGRPADAPDMGTASANAPAHEDWQDHRRLTVSDEDKVLHLAVLVAAMREQGFSARSIARVQQRAQEMLDAFGLEGIAVPRPRVFDPEAPSERDRRVRPAAGRTLAREIEREFVRDRKSVV